ncbi:MAG: N-6 DNA methylase [Chitinispirillaceae bacterium]|nr:N-6 DNA methylase [Chitinispirillaceae bacterium]
MAPDSLKILISRFTENRDSYSASTYNETQLRREFLDPFFEALGWDVANKQGYAEAYKEVIHEDAVKIGTATKAPDYSFRVGGTRKFFVEAKKPFINIKDDIEPAFQLRRYAWSAKLPLSILSDFEEFSVYDCRVKPVKTDKASIGRILYIRYDEYEKRWDEIASVFSKDAVLKGSFDRYAETNKAKKGTSEVDGAFLTEIETWRDLLARNIAIRNEKLSSRDLNFAVQRTIDRLIFLRICEDRGIEDYGRLLSHLNGENVYKRLCALFREADERYNSGLFHFREEKGREESPDNITLRLDIDDKVLKQIIQNLYYPDSAYEFSVLPADILGQVYEQFLGKVIRLTAGHQAKVEDKPEVKKAGGVFYTPTYIVDYIVKNTVGKLLEGKTPKQASALKILDPACGSGSFLIGAYQHLLDWHRDWYTNNDPEKWVTGKNPTIYKARAGEFRLTTPERKKILINNIYGVDIDSQAVEVTKLSLLLKVLEGENEQTIAQQLKLFHERALPDLGNNIKCGNSLVGTDYFQAQGVQETLPLYGDAESEEEKEHARVNPFDWDGPHGFREIMKAGGFDAVIGNPPYVRQEMLGEFKEYYKSKFKVYHGMADLYTYFFERGVRILNENGIFSIIVANKWMRANYGAPLRSWLKEHLISEIVDFGGLPVFKNATTYPCVITINKTRARQQISVCRVESLDFKDLPTYVNENSFKISLNSLRDEGWSLQDKKSVKLLEKIRAQGIPLKKFVDGQIFYGIKTGYNEAFIIDGKTRKKLIKEDPKSKEMIKPFLSGRDVQKWYCGAINQFLILIPKGWTNSQLQKNSTPWQSFKSKLPALAMHLGPYEKNAANRYDQGDYWWELRACEYYEEFQKPKIIVPAIIQSSTYSFDEGGLFSNDKTTIIGSDNLYLLGLLNSSTVDFVMHSIASTKQGGYYEYKPMYLGQLPIFPQDRAEGKQKTLVVNITAIVRGTLDLFKKQAQTADNHLKTLYQRQIESTDRRIDELVYELYGLTDEEIKIIEDSYEGK